MNFIEYARSETFFSFSLAATFHFWLHHLWNTGLVMMNTNFLINCALKETWPTQIGHGFFRYSFGRVYFDNNEVDMRPNWSHVFLMVIHVFLMVAETLVASLNVYLCCPFKSAHFLMQLHSIVHNSYIIFIQLKVLF